MKDRSALDWAGLILLVVGALNWGVLGLTALAGGSGTNVLGQLLVAWPMGENLVYVLVGLAGLWKLWKVFM